MIITPSDKFSISYRTIKNNQLFLVDDPQGCMSPENPSGLGLYFMDTRHLCHFCVRLNDALPIPLFSSTESGFLSSIVYTNPHLECQQSDGQKLCIPEMTLELRRETLLSQSLQERLILMNFNMESVSTQLRFTLSADFLDIFEVRHLFPAKRGTLLEPEILKDRIIFTYEDPKGNRLETVVRFKDFEPNLIEIKENQVVEFQLDAELPPLEPREYNLEIIPIVQSVVSNRGSLEEFERFDKFMFKAQRYKRQWLEQSAILTTDNTDFNEMLSRSLQDIWMLRTWTGLEIQGEDEDYIAAGIPWYVALFGRDSLITARDCLFINPNIAKSILKLLARYQGKEFDNWRDEEPGKILHELRVGELARMNEIPHTPYYGTVDATPLWLILLHDYYQWTHDRQTLEELWGNALQALEWIEWNLRNSPHGYLSYHKRSSKGLDQQGWKDSYDSVMYENGEIATPPIALVEAQGYVYAAKQKMAVLSDLLGHTNKAEQLRSKCKEFKERFNRDFWMDSLDYCALGLDKEGQQYRVIASNPGHCLETGIFTDDHAQSVALRLMEPDIFSGWGIRTLSSRMVAYNPMSYHNGSVWPHDNAMIARGLTAINRPELAESVFSGIYEAGRLMYYKRIPELFCGFSRDLERTDPPVKYPVACSPQAWAASSIFAFTMSLLRISPKLEERCLIITQPHLPDWVNSLTIENLRVHNSTLELEFRRTKNSVLLNVLSREGDLEIIMVK